MAFVLVYYKMETKMPGETDSFSSDIFDDMTAWDAKIMKLAEQQHQAKKNFEDIIAFTQDLNARVSNTANEIKRVKDLVEEYKLELRMGIAETMDEVTEARADITQSLLNREQQYKDETTKINTILVETQKILDEHAQELLTNAQELGTTKQHIDDMTTGFGEALKRMDKQIASGLDNLKSRVTTDEISEETKEKMKLQKQCNDAKSKAYQARKDLAYCKSRWVYVFFSWLFRDMCKPAEDYYTDLLSIKEEECQHVSI